MPAAVCGSRDLGAGPWVWEREGGSQCSRAMAERLGSKAGQQQPARLGMFLWNVSSRGCAQPHLAGWPSSRNHSKIWSSGSQVKNAVILVKASA